MSTKQEFLYQEWSMYYECACRHMEVCLEREGPTLLEVSAQHPLIDGLYPGEEFVRRLQMAKNIVCHTSLFVEDDDRSIYIYVPGSRRKCDGAEDKVSLSEAGVAWLKDNLPVWAQDKIIGGDEKNTYLTDGEDTFNGEDECYATTVLFNQLMASRLFCVCSQGQMMRKLLCYIRFEYYPDCFTVQGTFHKPTWEAIYGILDLLDTGKVMSNKQRASRIANILESEE